MKSTKSYWAETTSPSYGKLEGPCRADVAVIGGGITGLMAAYLLQKQGASVVLLEKDRIASGDSQRTTAHLTYKTDASLVELAKRFGADHAVASWDGGAAAIEMLHETSHIESIDCRFRWLTGYLHAPIEGEADEKELRAEADLAQQHGFDVKYLPLVPLMSRPGISFPRQAEFHATEFLRGLAAAIERKGRVIYEQSEVNEFSSDSTLVANGHVVEAKAVFVATHVPLQGRLNTPAAAVFQTKLHPYTSYVIRAEVGGDLEPALFWDTNDPYDYLRIDIEGTKRFAIFGGLDRKTGQEEADFDPFPQLEAKLKRIVEVKNVTHRWAGQVVKTDDGLPYIGEMGHNQFAATGYVGNGYTFGTLAAMIVADRIAGRKNPWAELFDPARSAIRRGLWDYLAENVDYPYYMAKKLFQRGSKDGTSSLANGEGGIFALDGKRVAVCRDRSGRLHTLEPECTHMGCLVKWNPSLQSWDCPCHGSRFTPDGAVLGGPAETPMEKAKPTA